jgi:uncharacterized protein
MLLGSAFSVSDHLLAALAACAAGIVNAVAGGGTLISFPTLVALGAGNVPANVTNAVALCPGYFGGTYAQRKDLDHDRGTLRDLAITAGAGGLTGSVLLIVSGEAVFKQIVPYLILLACVLLVSQNWIRRVLRIGQRTTETHARWAPLPAVFAASIYGGYFGAGLGIMLLAILGLLYADPLTRLNALKQGLSFVINIVAALFFVLSGEVIWSLALAMAPASLAGGAIGGRLVGHLNPQVMRVMVATYGTALAVWYLLR